MVYIYVCCIPSILAFSFNIPLRYPKITKIISYMIWFFSSSERSTRDWTLSHRCSLLHGIQVEVGKNRWQNCLPPKNMDWFEKRYFRVGVFLKHFWHKYDTKTFWWSLVLLFFWRKWPNIGFNHLEVWKSADVVVGLLTWLMLWNTRGKGDVLMQSLIKLAQWLCTK